METGPGIARRLPIIPHRVPSSTLPPARAIPIRAFAYTCRPALQPPCCRGQPVLFTMFKRIGNIIKGIFLRLIGKAERANPEALLEVEKESLRKQITEFNKALAAHAALVEDLKSRANKLDNREEELRAKTAANLKAGNRVAAGQLALKLKEVNRSHDEVARQFEQSEKRYKELIRARDVSVKEAKAKIEKLSHGINDMKVQRASAELNEMAAGMVTEIGGAGDTLSRLEEMVEEERTKAAGRGRVARTPGSAPKTAGRPHTHRLRG